MSGTLQRHNVTRTRKTFLTLAAAFMVAALLFAGGVKSVNAAPDWHALAHVKVTCDGWEGIMDDLYSPGTAVVVWSNQKGSWSSQTKSAHVELSVTWSDSPNESGGGTWDVGQDPACVPTVTPTNSPVPPSATATKTNTPVPPTATATKTNTPVPPSATPTPTNTPVLPTATSTNTPQSPSATPTEGIPTLIVTATVVKPTTPPSTVVVEVTPEPTGTTPPGPGPTPTDTPVATQTPTTQPTNTSTPVATSTSTGTPVPTGTPGPTATPYKPDTNEPSGDLFCAGKCVNAKVGDIITIDLDFWYEHHPGYSQDRTHPEKFIPAAPDVEAVLMNIHGVEILSDYEPEGANSIIQVGTIISGQHVIKQVQLKITDINWGLEVHPRELEILGPDGLWHKTIGDNIHTGWITMGPCPIPTPAPSDVPKSTRVPAAKAAKASGGGGVQATSRGGAAPAEEISPWQILAIGLLIVGAFALANPKLRVSPVKRPRG